MTAGRLVKPAFVVPMTATSVVSLPEGREWLYELKLDGYRALIMKDAERVQIRSRNEKDLTGAYPGVGKDLTTLPLSERKALLPKVLGTSGVLLSQELPGNARQVADAVSRLGLEGIIAKRRDSRYAAGQRPGTWVKLKLDKQQEFVIGGYRPGTHGIDALVVGYYEGGKLRYAGKVRAGFTPHVRREVFAALQGLTTAGCPFDDLPNSRPARWGGGITADQMAEMQWVKPRKLAQIRFVEWTAEGHLRHAAFLGLRSDKSARSVKRET